MASYGESARTRDPAMRIAAQSCQVLLASLGSAAVILAVAAAVTPARKPADPPPATNEVAAVESEPAVETPAPVEKGPAPAAAPWLSIGVQEIVKMADAGVRPTVLRAYIENSSIAYQPTADEVVFLHKHGLPADLVVAMLRHGGELRAKPAPVQGSAVAASTAAPVRTAPVFPAQAPVYAPAPVYVVTPPPAPVYVEAAPSYSYSYSYAYAYPGWSYASYPRYYSWYRPWGTWGGAGWWPRSSFHSYAPAYWSQRATSVSVGIGFGHRYAGGFSRPLAHRMGVGRRH
jgi:hypothetical protein